MAQLIVSFCLLVFAYQVTDTRPESKRLISFTRFVVLIPILFASLTSSSRSLHGLPLMDFQTSYEFWFAFFLSPNL
jgi:hypothetical protein